MILRQEEMISPTAHSNFRRKESSPLNGDCLQSSVVNGCKKLLMIHQRIHHIILALEKTHLKMVYISTRTFLNIKLKRVVSNFETTYRTERKINKRHDI